jgi:xylose isomerase
MATVNLFFDPAFRDGAFTANDARVRAFALQKTMRAMDLGAELGAKIFVLWGGREGTETDACRRPDEAVKRLREAVNYLCEYSIDRKYGFRFALEAKPNEPRGDIYMATTAAYLAFVPTLAHPMVRVKRRSRTSRWPGSTSCTRSRRRRKRCKLFHIDLNDQVSGRYDQTSASARQRRRRSGSSSSSRMSATRGRATSMRTRTAPKTTRASRTSRVAACART